MRHLGIHGLILAGAVFFWSAAPVPGQQDRTATFINQQRQYEEAVRLQLDRELPASQKVLVDWGGWFSSYVFNFEDGTKERTVWREDLRLWGSLSADEGIHQGYVRMQMAYDGWNHGTSYTGEDHDWDFPRLDRGWYQLDLAKMLRKKAGLDVPIDLSVKIGREYAMWGTGYALSMPLDMIQINGGIGPLKIDGLLGRTIHSWDNLDTSRPRPGLSNRYFYGVQTRWTGFARHEPFVYYLWQKDHQNDGDPVLKLQSWRYNSNYLGVGSRGQLFRNWRYSGEIVYENGDSYGNRAITNKDKICAYGWDAQLDYLAPWKTRPVFSLEYMFASGDPDRLFSPSNAVGGNRSGTKDTGFNAFGYRNTGLSFAPDLSNIHIWRAGASFFPLERHRCELLRRLQPGADFFLYHKNKRDAAVSDPLADEQSGFLGWEMDYYVNWRLTSDLAWTIRYGNFFPGAAFSERGEQGYRYFFLTGLTWSF